MENISWVILAGGNATRMNGEDKGLISANNNPMVEDLVCTIKSIGCNVTINANRHLQQYQEFAEVFEDTLPGRLGPLSGILAGLNYAKTDYVGFVPCDAPSVNKAFLLHLMEQSRGKRLSVAHDGDHIQPTFCVVHKSLAPQVERFLLDGERKVGLFLKQNQAHIIKCEEFKTCFGNLNTPTELHAFRNQLNVN